MITCYPFPWMLDKWLKVLEENGVLWTKEYVHVSLSYDDLPRKRGGEGILHRALKKYAYQMLKELGDPHPEYEYDYCDVYSKRLRIAIECGVTHISKVIELFFQWNMVNEVWVLDFPDGNGLAELIKFKRAKT